MAFVFIDATYQSCRLAGMFNTDLSTVYKSEEIPLDDVIDATAMLLLHYLVDLGRQDRVVALNHLSARIMTGLDFADHHPPQTVN